MNPAPQALPQTSAEALWETPYPEIVEAARDRGIKSIVHFTRTDGLKGILSVSAVIARRHLPEDARLKYVYEPNVPDRSRDEKWDGYVNLSVTDINMRMFCYSKKSHPRDDWVIVEFDPKILGDPGVVFCTSNNVYGVTSRSRGPRGFEQMFAPRVPWGHYGHRSSRLGRARNQPTNPQAEVLYPCQLPLDHLHTITAPSTATYEEVQAVLANVPPEPRVRINPEAFR